MSRINQFRETADAKLSKLNQRVDAFEAALHRTSAQVHERIHSGKQEVEQALHQLSAAIEQVQHLSADRKQRILTAIDTLRVQAALGKAEARDALSAARTRLHAIARDVEGAVDAGLTDVKEMPADVLDAAIGTYVRAIDRLDAELEAAEVRFATVKEQAGEAFERHRQELLRTVQQFKEKLAGKHEHAAGNLGRFEEEVRGGFAQVVTATKNLFA